MGTLWNGQGCSWSSIAIPPAPNSFVLVPEGNFSSMELLFLSVPKGQILSLSFCSHRFPSAKPNLFFSIYILYSLPGFSPSWLPWQLWLQEVCTIYEYPTRPSCVLITDCHLLLFNGSVNIVTAVSNLYYQMVVLKLDHSLRVFYRLLCPWDSPGKNTGVGNHFLLQGIFPTQGSNPDLWAHLRADSLPSELQGKPLWLDFYPINSPFFFHSFISQRKCISWKLPYISPFRSSLSCLLSRKRYLPLSQRHTSSLGVRLSSLFSECLDGPALAQVLSRGWWTTQTWSLPSGGENQLESRCLLLQMGWVLKHTGILIPPAFLETAIDQPLQSPLSLSSCFW